MHGPALLTRLSLGIEAAGIGLQEKADFLRIVIIRTQRCSNSRVTTPASSLNRLLARLTRGQGVAGSNLANS